MKRILCVIFLIVSCMMLTACEDYSEHPGEGKTPSGSIIMQGRYYSDVYETFVERGFTNIKIEQIADLIAGSSMENGEVEKVSVGGNVDYDVDKWVPADTEVIIYYHTFSDDEDAASSKNASDNENNDLSTALTIDNCPEFEKIVRKGIETTEDKDAWISFLKSNNGRIVEFAGTITDWYDDIWWVSISFDIAIEDSEYMSFSKSGVDLIELGMTGEYHYNNYHFGLIQEGMRVHVVAEIAETEDGWGLELDSMQIIE